MAVDYVFEVLWIFYVFVSVLVNIFLFSKLYLFQCVVGIFPYAQLKV